MIILPVRFGLGFLLLYLPASLNGVGKSLLLFLYLFKYIAILVA